MQVPSQCSKDHHPLKAQGCRQGLLKRRHSLPVTLLRASVAAALPTASKVGPVHRRHASALSHHLPGLWVLSLGTDRQLSLTMGKTAALPQRLWQQGKKILPKEYVKLLQILDVTAIMPSHS